jgi:murein DD-endopeptidase MepM/ murein hydrolase activator NlpD
MGLIYNRNQTYANPILEGAAKAADAFTLQPNQSMEIMSREDPSKLPTASEVEAQQSLVNAPERKAVALVDTQSAISTVNNKKAELDRIAPPPQPENTFDASGRQITAGDQQLTQPEPPPTEMPEGEIQKPKEEPKTTFINEDGQTREIPTKDLTPEIQEMLSSKGWVAGDSQGLFPGETSAPDPNKQQLEDDVRKSEQDVEDVVADFQSYNVDQDPDYQSYAKTINSQFEQMRRNMQRVNYSRQRAFETRAMRTGTAQYAGDVAGGIVGEEIRQGNERIAEITRQEMASIAQARMAFQEGEWSKFSRTVDALKDIREQKQEELAAYNQTLIDANKALDEKKKMAEIKRMNDFEIDKYMIEQSKGDFGTLSPGQSIWDKETGTIIGTAPEPDDMSAPTIKEINGVDMQWNPIEGTWEQPTGAMAQALSGASEDAKNWAGLITSGKADLTNIKDDNLRNQVAGILNNMPPKQEDVTAIEEKIKTLDSILNHAGKGESVGATKLTRIDWWKFSGAKQDFIGAVQQLLSEKTLQSLIDAKAEGATFGALSEGELRILEQAATRIGDWAIRNDEGKVVGYKVSEDAFDAEITRIKQDYQDLIKNQQTPARRAVEDFYMENPDKQEFIESLEFMKHPETGQPLTDEEKAQMLGIGGFTDTGGFSQESQTSLNGNVLGLGKITGYGSPLWEHGLDIDLKIGDPVPSPATGKVVFVGNNGGFGKQVQIETAKGNKVWLSHLDSFDVKEGDYVTKGSQIGKGGNTGKTIPGAKGDGSHLDLTVEKPDGTFYKPQEIYKILV